MDITKSVWLKTGTIITILTGVAGVLSALQTLPTDASVTMIAIAILGAILKRLNPADTPLPKE